jgi:hypothetical protein
MFSITIDWGDGSPVENLVVGGSGPPKAVAEHTYRDPGAYSITSSGTVESGPSGCVFLTAHYEFTLLAGPTTCPSSTSTSTGCMCPSPTAADTGYTGLDAAMKSALGQLYVRLQADSAHCTWQSGFRDAAKQKALYEKWHRIADHHENDPMVCAQEHRAGFKQCPTGYRKNGIAKGGPAKQSRHEVGEAADIKVLFPPSYREDITRYRAAARAAGLCGPASSDSVHVELPYVKAPAKVAVCHGVTGP